MNLSEPVSIRFAASHASLRRRFCTRLRRMRRMRRFTWLPVGGTRAQPRAKRPCGRAQRTPDFARDRGPRHSLGSSAGSATCALRPARIGRTRPMQLAATRETARDEGVGSRWSLCRADSVHGRLRPPRLAGPRGAPPARSPVCGANSALTARSEFGSGLSFSSVGVGEPLLPRAARWPGHDWVAAAGSAIEGSSTTPTGGPLEGDL